MFLSPVLYKVVFSFLPKTNTYFEKDFIPGLLVGNRSIHPVGPKAKSSQYFDDCH